jgi:hypothetical protein
MKQINPEWNKEWKRWEVPDEENESMRALNHFDLMYMADCVVAGRGIEPGLNEEAVDRALAKLEKKYGILSPLPIWAALFLDEYDKARDVCTPSVESVEAMLRKHAGL